MLDLIYILATAALFALVALVARGVEKLGPAENGSARRDAVSGGEHR